MMEKNEFKKVLFERVLKYIETETPFLSLFNVSFPRFHKEYFVHNFDRIFQGVIKIIDGSLKSEEHFVFYDFFIKQFSKLLDSLGNYRDHFFTIEKKEENIPKTKTTHSFQTPELIAFEFNHQNPYKLILKSRFPTLFYVSKVEPQEGGKIKKKRYLFPEKLSFYYDNSCFSVSFIELDHTLFNLFPSFQDYLNNEDFLSLFSVFVEKKEDIVSSIIPHRDTIPFSYKFSRPWIRMAFSYRSFYPEEKSRIGNHIPHKKLEKKLYEFYLLKIVPISFILFLHALVFHLHSRYESVLNFSGTTSKSFLQDYFLTIGKELKDFIEERNREFFFYSQPYLYSEKAVKHYISQSLLDQILFFDKNKEFSLKYIQAFFRISCYLLEFSLTPASWLWSISTSHAFIYDHHLIISSSCFHSLPLETKEEDIQKRFKPFVNKVHKILSSLPLLQKDLYFGLFLHDETRNWVDNLHPFPFIDTLCFTVKDTLSFFNLYCDLFGNLLSLRKNHVIWSDNIIALHFLDQFALFSEKISCIYIDPPYNRGLNDFTYRDRYSLGFWNHLLNSRLYHASLLLDDEGIFYCSIGESALTSLLLLVEKNFRYRFPLIVWHKKTQPSYLSKEFIPVNDYLVAAKNSSKKLTLLGSFGDIHKLTELINIGNPLSERRLPRTHVLIKNGWSGTLYSGIYGNEKLAVTLINGPIVVKNGIPDQDLLMRARFKWSQERIDLELQKGGKIHIKSIRSLRPTIERHYDSPIVKAPTTLLSKKINGIPTNTDANMELKSLFGISPFDYSKPVKLLSFLFRSILFFKPSSYVLDFFAGTGTSAQALLELNDVYHFNASFILVEKGFSFNSVLLPRLRKLMISQEWKKGKPLSNEGFDFSVDYFSLTNPDDLLVNLCCITNKEERDLLFSYYRDLFHIFYWDLVSFSSFSRGSLDEWEYCNSIFYFLNSSTLSIEPRLLKEYFWDPWNVFLFTVREGVFSLQRIDLAFTISLRLGIRVTREFVHSYHIQNKDKMFQILVGKDCEHKKILIICRKLLNFESNDKEYIREEHNIIFGNLLERISCKSPDKIYINGPPIHEGIFSIRDLLLNSS